MFLLFRQIQTKQVILYKIITYIRHKLYLQFNKFKIIIILTKRRRIKMQNNMFYAIGETILLEVNGIKDVEYCGNEKEMVLTTRNGEKVKIVFEQM